MQGHTAKNGTKTATHTRHSAIVINNKDPNFDYAMVRRKDVEDGGGTDIYGYEPIGEHNYNGETFGAFPYPAQRRKSKQLIYLDTIACKRPKEISRYLKAEEDIRYNAQVDHVRNASKRIRMALRDLDPESVVTEKSTVFDAPSMQQRKGPTEE